MQTQNPITPQIEQAINYYTNRLGRSFRLQPADKDDIRQELTLKALEAIQSHNDDMGANSETYTRQALRHKAVDLAGAIISSVSPSDIDTEDAIVATETNANLGFDIQHIIQTLPVREQTICRMLMAGCTQEEIANEIGLTQRGVGFCIEKIRPVFENFQNTTS